MTATIQESAPLKTSVLQRAKIIARCEHVPKWQSAYSLLRRQRGRRGRDEVASCSSARAFLPNNGRPALEPTCRFNQPAKSRVLGTGHEPTTFRVIPRPSAVQTVPFEILN